MEKKNFETITAGRWYQARNGEIGQAYDEITELDCIGVKFKDFSVFYFLDGSIEYNDPTPNDLIRELTEAEAIQHQIELKKAELSELEERLRVADSIKLNWYVNVNKTWIGAHYNTVEEANMAKTPDRIAILDLSKVPQECFIRVDENNQPVLNNKN